MSAQLRLFVPGDDQEDPEMAWDRMRWDGERHVPDAEPIVTTNWRFSKWFLDYWVPWGLFAGEDPARDKTVLGYFDAARYALRCAGDPHLKTIGESWVQRFHAGLKQQTWCRSHEMKTQRPLSAETQAKHRRQIATCIRELVWQGLIKPLRVRRRSKRRAGKVRPVVKPAYSVAELRQIVARAESVPVQGFTGDRLRSLWRSVYGFGFYTGLRREALLSATWAHVSVLDGVYWLRAPAEITKDSEAWEGPLYGPLVTELLAIRGEDARLVPWPYGADWLLTRHKQVCQALGITGRGRDLHGLKRSHLLTLSESGFDAEKQSLALLAGHSEVSTTFSHYTPVGKLRAKYIPHMPALW